MEKINKKLVPRRQQRELAVQLLFEMKIQKEENIPFVLNYFESRELDMDRYPYAYEIAKKYIENMDEVEAILRENIHSWKVERVGKTEISAIRVATVEMLYFDDVPPAVSINEAVEIAKKFSDEKSYSFVNKLLKNVLEAIKEI